MGNNARTGLPHKGSTARYMGMIANFSIGYAEMITRVSLGRSAATAARNHAAIG
jgi:hypothetical protein